MNFFTENNVFLLLGETVKSKGLFWLLNAPRNIRLSMRYFVLEKNNFENYFRYCMHWAFYTSTSDQIETNILTLIWKPLLKQVYYKILKRLVFLKLRTK